MTRTGPLTAGATALLLLGGGLLGWHLYLDHTEYRPPAVALSHGECQGTLDDPGITALLGSTPRVFVDTGVRPATPDLKPGLVCTVQGQGQRLLFASVLSAGDANGTEDGEAAFGCTLNGKAEPYRARLRVDRNFPPTAIPDQEHRAELVTGFAKRAAEKLGCANGAESLTVK
ncbi:hypothetical protein [Kitasatospora cathayae]|uniref:DUF3558 domain-containing protein n=1 Tax=Kitasatospora cathayae TaxID=3004092 RepID=A0ABY7Q551_9ACTN|nr:hypothetical protein [Kitasatospora sp. HUAS 3-15]WBP87747.1 hypothetical protein O1G21_19110 [Kitasatospora sp. HUAS 3-15]